MGEGLESVSFLSAMKSLSLSCRMLGKKPSGDRSQLPICLPMCLPHSLLASESALGFCSSGSPSSLLLCGGAGSPQH